MLLEQLRTLDKRRLENYVCTLDRTEMEKINKAIRRSTGIPKIIEKPLVVSLCRVCAGNFYDVPGHYIRRVNPEQRYKDTLILSILVDTFISKISLPMQPVPEIRSISGA